MSNSLTPDLQKQQAHASYAQGVRAVQNAQWDTALKYFADALRLDSHNARYVLYLGTALWQTGDKPGALSIWSLGADKDPMVRIAQYHAQADEMTRQMSNLADTELRRHFTNMQSAAIRQVGGTESGRLASAIWPQTHAGKVTYPENGPRPHMFYAPALPELPVFDRLTTPWVSELETMTDIIRAEYLALMSENEKTGAPYVNAKSFLGKEWDKLKGQSDWTAVHLYSDGKPTDSTPHCPKTDSIIRDLPLVYHGDNPMEVFFSVLKPRTAIPPHYGLANCRVTAHLPLIIPGNCAIRVQDMEHTWREGEMFIFDDSFDHEAWNNSDQTRVVLIFEAWRPDMTEGEVKAVEASYKARQSWLDNRKMPDLVLLSGAT